ncbi:S8 family serine peptidase [Bacillus haimaensis]|uniref:S8 family serine peptidase n=1 Tax=Bacillus haimaensis TaxID=3160967 RepID=UPI003AA8803F
MMKSSTKKIFSGLFAGVLLLNGAVAPASAGFQLPEGGAVQSQALQKDAQVQNVFDMFNEQLGNDPLYGEKLSNFNPNEKVRLVVEVDVDEKAKTLPETQIEEVKNRLSKARTSSSKVRHTYTDGFHGFSMESTLADVEKVKALKGVKDVRIAKTYEQTVVNSKDLVEAMNVWTKYNYRGDGMVVAVVDSGIDYRHEAMTLSENGKKSAKLTEGNIQSILDSTEISDTWYSEKVPTGYDWADKDNDVIPSKDSHGTHVAGIVGAFEESQKKAVGVAPDVQLIAEKVFSDTAGYAYDDDIAAGIYHAVEVGADVINLSLGSEAGSVDANDPIQRAIQFATENGVLVVAAAGNAAYSTKQNLLERSQLPLAKNPDIGLVGDPGVTPYALQVASSENDLMKVDGLRLNDGSTLGYQIQPSSKKLIGNLDATKEYELVYVGEGRSADVKDLDLTGKIAIAKPLQSYATYSYIQNEAGKKGAAAVIVIPPSNLAAYSYLYFSPYFIPGVTTDQVEANRIIELLQSGEKISVQLSDEGLWVQNTATEPMSTFSSFGSPTDLSFKPEITAPGGKISSTVINNQYETMSGTSMSSPHVAGGGALLLQKYYQEWNLPKTMDTVLKAKNALMNTSEQLTNPKEQNALYSPRRQGSGMMKIEQALNTPYLLQHVGVPLEEAASVALKEIDRTFDFTLEVEALAKNLVHPKHQYEIYVDVLTDETEKRTYDGIEREYLTLNSIPVEDAVIKINGKQQKGNSKFQYKPHRDDKVTISVTLPKELSEGRFVEGFVRFVPKGSSVRELTNLTIPFMGYYGDWGAISNVDESPVTGDAFLGYTVLWNEILNLPLGYDSSTGTFDKDIIGVSSESISSGAYPSFTALRNLKEMSLSIQDEKGNTVSTIGNFNEFTEDGSPYPFRKNIMSYRNYYYSFEYPFWNSLDDAGNILPDGQYYYVFTSKLDFEGAEPQEVKVPIKVDATAPLAKDIKVEEQQDGKYRITWNVKEEGTGYKGSILWVNGSYKSLPAYAKEYISTEKPEIVMILAVDHAQNAGVSYFGNEELLHADPFINYMYVSGSNINQNKPASITVFGYKRLDWHFEISDAEGNVLEEADIENEHSIYGLKWYPDTEYPNGDYFVTVTGTDENGLSLTSKPYKMTVKH